MRSGHDTVVNMRQTATGTVNATATKDTGPAARRSSDSRELRGSSLGIVGTYTVRGERCAKVLSLAT
ncbi:MAG: hypothetical protein ACREMS_00640 [Gemmatimonadaceae bacterium]